MYICKPDTLDQTPWTPPPPFLIPRCSLLKIKLIRHYHFSIINPPFSFSFPSPSPFFYFTDFWLFTYIILSGSEFIR